jgi:hypothetical protein
MSRAGKDPLDNGETDVRISSPNSDSEAMSSRPTNSTFCGSLETAAERDESAGPFPPMKPTRDFSWRFGSAQRRSSAVTFVSGGRWHREPWGLVGLGVCDL